MFRLFAAVVVTATLVLGAGDARAGTHTVTSRTVLDAAFWAGVLDGDVLVLQDDVTLTAPADMTGKSVTIKSADGKVKTITAGANPLQWVNIAAGPDVSLVLDGVAIAGGAGTSMGGGLHTSTGSAPATPLPGLSLTMKNGAAFANNTASGLNGPSGVTMMGVFDLGLLMRGMGGGLMVHSAAIDGDAVIFRDNTAILEGDPASLDYFFLMFGGAGGGLAAIDRLTIDADSIVFTGNKALDQSTTGTPDSAAGGGLWASFPTLTAKTITFSDNSVHTQNDDGGIGGAIHAGVLNMTADVITMRGNTASGEGDHTGFGGAVYVTQNATMDGDMLFENNTAKGEDWSSGKGGAIYSNGELTLTGSAVFRNNTAQGVDKHSGLGGAIISRHFSLENAAFTNNRAISDGVSDYSGLGGAVYFHTQGYTHSDRLDDTENIGVISAGADRETVFQGNTDGDSANRRPNALFMGTYETASNKSAIVTEALQTGTLKLSAAEGGVISFHDPIASDKRKHSIVVNENSGDTGLVRFWGDNEYYGSTTVANGTMLLMPGGDQGATVYGRKGENNAGVGGGTLDSLFTVKSTGTLGMSAGATIHADTFVAENGAGFLFGASSLAAGTHVLGGAIQTLNPVLIAGLMESAGNLYSAKLVANGNNADIEVTVHNAADAWGGDYVFLDAFRQGGLGSLERAWVDSLFAGGVTSADMPVIQALRGDAVAAGAGGQRSTFTAFAGTVSERFGLAGGIDRAIAEAAGGASDQALASFAACGSSFANNIWASAGKHFIRQDSRRKVAGYRFDPYTLAIGYDRRIGSWTFGVAAQYADGDLKARNNIAKTDITSLIGSLYAGYTHGGFYANASFSAGMGWNDVVTHYNRFASQSKGSYDSSIVGGNLELGYEFSLPGSPIGITPHVGLDYAHVRTDSFTEHSKNGAPVRHFGKSNTDMAEIPLGVTLAGDFTAGCSTTVRPYIDAAYIRSVGDVASSVTASFVGAPGSAWTAQDIGEARNAFRIKAGFQARFNDRVTVDLTYGARLRSGYRDHSGSISFSTGF